MDPLPPLADLSRRLEAQLPGLRLHRAGRGVAVERQGRRVVLAKNSCGAWSREERQARRAAGESYLDVSAGEVFIDEEGLLLFLALGRAGPRLTPHQCVLLAAALEEGKDWLGSAVVAGSRSVAERFDSELGIAVAPAAATKLVGALRNSKIIVGEDLDRGLALDVLIEEFRLSGIGKVDLFPAPAKGLEAAIGSRLASRLVEGVAAVVQAETGVLIEPWDWIATREDADEVRRRLGNSVGPSFSGRAIAIRRVTRAPLGDLTVDGARLNPLLGLIEASKSGSGLAEQAAIRALAARR